MLEQGVAWRAQLDAGSHYVDSIRMEHAVEVQIQQLLPCHDFAAVSVTRDITLAFTAR